MSEVDDRLLRCFASVYPTISETEIQACDVALLFETDSLAGVTLVSVIDQEFGVDMDISDLLSLKSFAVISEFLGNDKGSNGQSEGRPK